eukprot:m.10502 g.10502  ORF g.10502 m.10502 type:complete len:56 (-) comp3677_c0_seq4:1419-1586(-)
MLFGHSTERAYLEFQIPNPKFYLGYAVNNKEGEEGMTYNVNHCFNNRKSHKQRQK